MYRFWVRDAKMNYQDAVLGLRSSNIFFFFFLGLPLQHMEVFHLGVKSALQLPAYATAMATPVLSRICKLCLSLW